MKLLRQLTKWQAQYFSWIFGACVPLPMQTGETLVQKGFLGCWAHTSSGRAHQNHPDGLEGFV